MNQSPRTHMRQVALEPGCQRRPRGAPTGGWHLNGLPMVVHDPLRSLAEVIDGRNEVSAALYREYRAVAEALTSRTAGYADEMAALSVGLRASEAES